ncbi:sensor histidine kinase [Paenibacillus sp. D2_2]|uniref:sensor histidine kinase n=1 Tax=Paenibacillus sp. D2_2 TaxID=3073092 RepID=UPI0028155C4C|nr:sensor histidine kinase [Paenibacillus sp. D2_2]WMT42221.1 sensor histidine kinase [Paenibacillus sp. D2_2]
MLNKAVRMTNNLKLKHKLIISYIVVVMIPVLLVGGGMVAYFRAQAMERAISQTTNNVQKIKTQLSNIMRMPNDVSNTLLMDKALEKVASTHYPSVLELTKSYLSFDSFHRYINMYREIAEIRIYYNNPTLINNLEIVPVDAQIESSYWYKEAMESRRAIWQYINDDEEFPIRKLSLVRQVNFPETHTSGVLVVALDQEELNRMLRQEPFETLIADERGYIVAAKNPALVGSTLNDLDYGVNLNEQGKGAHKLDIHGESSYMIVDQLMPEAGTSILKIVSIFDTASIMEDANKVSFFGLLIIILVLIIALFFVYIVSFWTTNRLLQLSRQFNRVALGNMSTMSRIDGNDEIGQLSRQFNYMVDSIKQLMAQIVEKTEQNNALEIAQREIKLKMMASQINPHFLFNALESIRMNAHMKGDKEIANVVRLLGKLMRKNMEVGREKTQLKEEIEMVRSYLEIQKFRYEDRLNFELNVEPLVESVLIPPLVIQPLVENAVVHGVEGKIEGVNVKLSVEIIGTELQVTVQDDGVGMTEERLAEVIQATVNSEEPARQRIGLRNVHQRLVLSYGEEHGLIISSTYEEGTKITFTVPLIEVV